MFRLILFLGVMTLSWGPTQAEASVVEGLGLEELVGQADEVALAEVLSKESFWKGRTIMTRYRLRVSEALKGQCASGDEVLIETPGGSVGDVGLAIEGVPSFEVGGRALVFLRGRAEHVLRTVGMAQGVMHVRSEGTRSFVYPDNRGLVTVQRTAAGRLAKVPAALTKREALEVMIDRVVEIVSKEKR